MAEGGAGSSLDSNDLDEFANFKGVMLCTRPVLLYTGRNLKIDQILSSLLAQTLASLPVPKSEQRVERKYCSTVTGRYELGINPSKIKERRERKSRKNVSE